MVEQAPADLVLTGGTVYTVDAARSWAQAVAVRGGRIAAVGSDADMRAYVGPHTEVVSLRGRMVLPGFQDAHVHAASGGLERNQCDLSGLHSRAGYLAPGFRLAHEWRLAGGATAVWLYTEGPARGCNPRPGPSGLAKPAL